MTYIFFIWKSHRGLLLVSMIFISIIQFLILKMVTTIDYSEMLPQLLSQLPENIRALFGDDAFSMATVEGAAAAGLNHPLVLVMLSLAAVMIPSQHIAGEAETGTLELILSFPVRRTTLLINLYVSAVVFLFGVILCALCASLLSISLFHQLTSVLFVKLLTICCNLWLLFICIMSITMVLSVFEKDGNKVGMRAASVVLFFYLLHYLSSIWDAIRFTKPFNIFNYYQPTALMNDQRSFLLHFSVLFTLILICFFVSIYQFNRRDIPG